MSAAVLEVRGLEVRYGDESAVVAVDLRVTSAGILALLGESGCGKTTLLRAIAGFERPSAGTIDLAGERVAGPGVWVPPERRKVGMVFQEGALFPHLSVLENVRYGVRRLGAGDESARGALALVRMESFAARYPDELSGGERQRVALARALAPRPRLVLLDEPFASLDPGLREALREEVRAILHEAEATAILVTHDREEALSVADRVAVMRDGHILESGSPEELYRNSESLEVAEFLGDGQRFECVVEGGVAQSLFGRVAALGPEGPGLLLLRPEDLEVAPRNNGEGVPGTVVGSRFFGHDRVDEVRLDSGELCAVRRLSGSSSPSGTSVRLSLRDGAFRIYPLTRSARKAGAKESRT